jgi:hypothetical protein
MVEGKGLGAEMRLLFLRLALSHQPWKMRFSAPCYGNGAW